MLRVALYTAAGVACFGSVVALAALLVSWWQGGDSLTSAGVLTGVICGLIAWLFIVTFHIKRESVTLPFDDGEAFLRRVRSQMEEMGYTVTAASESVLVARPPFGSLLFGGQLVARLGENQAVLVGPKFYVEWLRKGCRVHNHLEQVHQTLAASRLRHGEPLLSEAEFRLQLPGELLPEVYRQVATALAREGAALQCELCIRARCETGLRERVVDTQVRDWLKDRQLVVAVRKEPLANADTQSNSGTTPCPNVRSA